MNFRVIKKYTFNKKFPIIYLIEGMLQLKKCNKILKTVKILKNCKKQKSKVILFGNGASASIANHVSVDLTKNSKISSLNFNIDGTKRIL